MLGVGSSVGPLPSNLVSNVDYNHRGDHYDCVFWGSGGATYVEHPDAHLAMNALEYHLAQAMSGPLRTFACMAPCLG